MERDHVFTFDVAGDGVYDVTLFEAVDVEEHGGTVTGHWPEFDIQVAGGSAAEVYDAVMAELRRQVGDAGPTAYAPLMEYVRRHGVRVPETEVAARERKRVEALTVRWCVSDDEQYTVAPFRGVEIDHGVDAVTARAFGLTGTGPALGEALQNLLETLRHECGERAAPGPRYDEFTAWARAEGEAVSAQVLAQEAEEQRAYLTAREQLRAITPDDIATESSTGIPLLVDFWAEWCGPCRMVTPVLAGLAQQWEGRLVVRKIDVDQFDGIWERFDFRGIPAMILFKDGAEIHRIIGFGGKAKLVAELEPHLG